MIRPLLSLKRLFFDETEGKVRYQYSRQGSQEEPKPEANIFHDPHFDKGGGLGDFRRF